MEHNSAIPDGDLILFDGTCVFCSAFARFMVRWDRAGHFRFVTAHSPLGQALYAHYGLDGQAMTTNIVVVNGVPHVKLRAFAAAMRRIGWPWRVMAVLDVVPRAIADPVYDWIARNRYRLGRRACPVPGPELRARLIE
jgi:predicted DCC family thiol-disulfide oxidoreductase YuxK